MPEVSVVIPTYARQKETVRAVVSVIDQDIDLQIVVVDDASPVPFVLPSNLEHDKRIQVVRREKNGGASAARNTGIATASADIITFLDSDDQLLPVTLGKRVKFAMERSNNLGAHPYLMVGCGWIESGEVPRPNHIRIPISSNKLDDFYRGCWVCPGSCVLFNREIFNLIGGFDETLRRLEDVDLFIRIGQLGGRYVSQNLAGALIDRSSEKSSVDIKLAAHRLLEKYTNGQDLNLNTNAKQLRLLRAYIELEFANDARRAGWPIRTLLHLASSFLSSPRTRLQLVPGWNYMKIEP